MPPSPTNLSSAQSYDRPEVVSLAQLHTIITFVITTLGFYLQFQAQPRNISPFDEHRNIFLAIFVSLFMYAMGLMAQFKLKTHNSNFLSIIKRFNPLIGIFVVVLLLIILYPLLGLVAFIIWALFMMEAVIKSSQEIFQWLRTIFICTKEIIRSYFNREENPSSADEGNGSVQREENDLPEDQLPPV